LLFNCIKSDKGIALVAVLGISLILMGAAMALGLSAGFFGTTTKITREIDQMRFVADFGLENYRYYLWNQGCPPPGWCSAETDENGTKQEIPQDRYASVMWNLKNSNLFPAQNFSIDDHFSFQHHIAKNYISAYGAYIIKGHVHFRKDGSWVDDRNYDYTVYAKRGPNPKILYVVSTSMKRRKIGDASLPVERYPKRSSVEVALHFSLPCPEEYKQFGQCPSKTGESGEIGVQTQLFGGY